jgi:hypothetical protein
MGYNKLRIGGLTMRLKDYQFGFADATKEFTRVPRIFEEAFCDRRNIINKLLYEYHYLLIGRKGVGKSAYCSKIQSIAKKSDSIHAFPLQLNDFEFTTFAKTSVDSDVIGTQKYKASWDFLLMLTFYKIIVNELKITEVEEINNIVYLLGLLGFPLDAGYKLDVTRLSKLKIGISVVEFDAEFEKEFKIKPSSYLDRISTITDKMINVLTKVYLNQQKIIIIIDGLDDILRYKKHKFEIISSLIRSVDYLNDRMLSNKLDIKTILLIREDIICCITDPDLNKIVLDGAISVSWNNRLEDLKELVKLRFKFSGIDDNNIDTYWDRIFPRKIRNKTSWNYMLDYTVYKPRDVLQFLKCCQNEYPDNESLSMSEFQNALKIYSNKYFIEEMKNELTGFIDHDLIIILPSVFRRLGRRSFDFAEIYSMICEQSQGKNFSDGDVKALLLALFDSGYIGQIIPANKDTKEMVIYKYRNASARIDYYLRFITHKGIHSGLGI